MTTSDYILDSVLVLLVVRQIRESRLDKRAILLPLGIMAFVVHKYLHGMPSGTNSLVLVGALGAVGLVIGTASALTTRVRFDEKGPLVKAGWIAAGLWVLSMGSRMAFAIWSDHAGAPTIAKFSAEHALSAQAWTTALVMMAIVEVVSRTGILAARAYLPRATRTVTPAAQTPKSLVHA